MSSTNALKIQNSKKSDTVSNLLIILFIYKNSQCSAFHPIVMVMVFTVLFVIEKNSISKFDWLTSATIFKIFLPS